MKPRTKVKAEEKKENSATFRIFCYTFSLLPFYTFMRDSCLYPFIDYYLSLSLYIFLSFFFLILDCSTLFFQESLYNFSLSDSLEHAIIFNSRHTFLQRKQRPICQFQISTCTTIFLKHFFSNERK